MDSKLILTAKEVAERFADPVLAAKYPVILKIEQVAELVAIPISTLYSWSSQGKLQRCSRRVGKHLRFDRNKFYFQFFNGELNDD